MSKTPGSTPGYDFSGDIAVHYEECLGPMFFEPYAIEVAKLIEPSSVAVAVELASGTGRVTCHLRNRLPATAKLIASDISQDMLSIAKIKSGKADIDWQTIDAQQLPFEENSIDLIVCCFGYMFVPDKPKAFAEAYRVLRKGGMLLFTTWDKLEFNGLSYTYRSIATEYLQGPLPESFNLPFSMSDESVIKSLLHNAGFLKISIEHSKLISRTKTAREAINNVSQGGYIYNEIMKQNPAIMDEIRIRAEKELAEKYGAAPMVAPMSAIISQAWK